MLQAIENLIIAGLVSVAASVWGIVHYKLKKDENNKLYRLRDREMAMQEEVNNVKIDYMRELVSQNRLELTSDGQFREKKGA